MTRSNGKQQQSGQLDPADIIAAIKEALKAPDVLQTVSAIVKNVVCSEITDLISKQDEFLNEIKNDNIQLKCEMEPLQYQLDIAEQYSRRNNLRIFGLTESADENVQDVVYSLIRDNLGIVITDNDIAVCHRVGKAKEDRFTRSILLKFTSYDAEISIW